jgi:hypothetical protein
MTGETNLQDRWNKIRENVDQYLASLHSLLLKCKEVDPILSMRLEDLRKLNSIDCYEYAYILDRHALYLQSELNQHIVQNAWAKHSLDLMLGSLLMNYGTQYTKFEEKKLMIISDNEYCKALHQMISSSDLRIKSIYELASKINIIGKTLKDLGYSKRKEE